MNIKTPVATWILARLFNENKPVLRKDLLRNLCQASFDSMTSDDDFSKTTEMLVKGKYIQSVDIDNATGTTGYLITEEGIIAFRRQISTALEKIQRQLDKIPSVTRNSKFTNIVNALKSNSNILTTSIKLCIDNAPQILEFIKTVTNELRSVGILVSS
ncbi:MAG TPA: hypothetical protein VEU72_01975 [Nitrosopumilaceae archaeon]|nr:hypothetical protein [Nitrosopumilaceae archaeon]